MVTLLGLNVLSWRLILANSIVAQLVVFYSTDHPLRPRKQQLNDLKKVCQNDRPSDICNSVGCGVNGVRVVLGFGVEGVDCMKKRLTELMDELLEAVKKDDDESAHGCEDALREAALEIIASGDVDIEAAKEIAKFALSTKDLDFRRWYA